MAERLYKVTALSEKNAKNRLIKASSKGQVASHIISALFTIEPASPLDVAEYFSQAGRLDIETAKAGE